MNDQTSYSLSDDVIAHVAQLLQLAILTGTDIVDNLRMIRLTQLGEGLSTLRLDPEYKQNSESNVEKMMSEVENYKENFNLQD
jgi:hypothetical protein|tara:strand:- start:578 stop:826 length:249 start_codon:yes stop_codon:yes gene_type:complete